MKYLTIILIILLISTTCFAGDGKYVWDVHYVMGTCLLNTSLMYGFNIPFWKSTGITFSASFVKELIDDRYTAGKIQRSKSRDYVLDHTNGFDVRDLKLACYGIGLSSISYFCNKIFVKMKFELYLNQSTLAIQYKF